MSSRIFQYLDSIYIASPRFHFVLNLLTTSIHCIAPNVRWQLKLNLEVILHADTFYYTFFMIFEDKNKLL